MDADRRNVEVENEVENENEDEKEASAVIRSDSHPCPSASIRGQALSSVS